MPLGRGDENDHWPNPLLYTVHSDEFCQFFCPVICRKRSLCAFLFVVWSWVLALCPSCIHLGDKKWPCTKEFDTTVQLMPLGRGDENDHWPNPLLYTVHSDEFCQFFVWLNVCLLWNLSIYNIMVRWFAGTNELLTKCPMFQVLFFFIISWKILCKNYFNLFFYRSTKIKIMSFECPQFIRNYKKNNAWNIERLVDDSFVPANQRIIL